MCVSPRVEKLKVKKINKRFVPELKKVVNVSGFLCKWTFYISVYLYCCIMAIQHLDRSEYGEDYRKLAVTQPSVKDHHLTLVWKTRKKLSISIKNIFNLINKDNQCLYAYFMSYKELSVSTGSQCSSLDKTKILYIDFQRMTVRHLNQNK